MYTICEYLQKALRGLINVSTHLYEVLLARVHDSLVHQTHVNDELLLHLRRAVEVHLGDVAVTHLKFKVIIIDKNN